MVADGELLTYQAKSITNSTGLLLQHSLPREFRLQANEVIYTYQNLQNSALDMILQVPLEQELDKLCFILKPEVTVPVTPKIKKPKIISKRKFKKELVKQVKRTRYPFLIKTLNYRTCKTNLNNLGNNLPAAIPKKKGPPQKITGNNLDILNWFLSDKDNLGKTTKKIKYELAELTKDYTTVFRDVSIPCLHKTITSIRGSTTHTTKSLKYMSRRKK